MGMEDDTRAFLVLIVNTIALVLMWMIANVLVGIYWGYAFYTLNVGWENILYYIISLATLVWLVWYITKKWKGYL
jgi:ABC-type glycerol-3-phosphate transport system permease component